MKASCNENHWKDAGYITIENWGEGEKEKNLEKFWYQIVSTIFHFTLKKPGSCR